MPHRASGVSLGPFTITLLPSRSMCTLVRRSIAFLGPIPLWLGIAALWSLCSASLFLGHTCIIVVGCLFTQSGIGTFVVRFCFLGYLGTEASSLDGRTCARALLYLVFLFTTVVGDSSRQLLVVCSVSLFFGLCFPSEPPLLARCGCYYCAGCLIVLGVRLASICSPELSLWQRRHCHIFQAGVGRGREAIKPHAHMSP